ncbi:MAG TPA: diguanylate cyclase [Pirellulales bacterium]|nr:diguanylate cyclase [Pirellulales bacterium]
MQKEKFSVLLVDDDPAVLWSLSNFLKLAGYEVLPVGAAEQALTVCDFAPPDFVIAGWSMTPMSGVELCRRIRGRALPDYVYILLRGAPNNSNQVIDALQAGADDFLAQPLVHGELLSRLRAGVRMLEYERRLASLARGDALTGLGARQAFREQIEKRLAQRRRGPACCVVFDADFFERVNHLYGRPMGDAALQALADRLAVDQDSRQPYRVGGNRFAVLIDQPEEEALEWAEHSRLTLETQPLSVAGEAIALTVSAGVAPLTFGLSGEAALALAEQTLHVAKESGRNRVLSTSGVAGVMADRIGSDPLRSAVARDVMTSSVIALGQDESLAVAAELLGHCQLSTLPVVDADGKLLGTVSAAVIDARMSSLAASTRTLAETVDAHLTAYDEETTVQTLYEFFQRTDADRAEITHAGRPTGYVTRGSLAALSEHLTPATFAPTSPPAYGSAYLRVPELVGEEG